MDNKVHATEMQPSVATILIFCTALSLGQHGCVRRYISPASSGTGHLVYADKVAVPSPLTAACAETVVLDKVSFTVRVACCRNMFGSGAQRKVAHTQTGLRGAAGLDAVDVGLRVYLQVETKRKAVCVLFYLFSFFRCAAASVEGVTVQLITARPVVKRAPKNRDFETCFASQHPKVRHALHPRCAKHASNPE